MLAGDMCACLPIENAALFKFSFLPPFMDAMTSPTAPSTTLLKYASDIVIPVRRSAFDVVGHINDNYVPRRSYIC